MVLIGTASRAKQTRHRRTIPNGFEFSSATFIEGAREKMVRGPKRQMQGHPMPLASPDELASLQAICFQHVIEPQPDQLEACVIQLPPHAAINAPAPAASGQFQVVMSGAMRHGNEWLSAWESRYLGSSEPAGAVEASAEGAQVLVLQVPAKASEYCL